MNKKSCFLILACFFSLISFPLSSKASDTNTAISIIENMKNTRVKVYGSGCGHDWKNKYDFVSSRAKILFVGQVISIGEVFEGRSKVSYKIITPINGVSQSQKTIDIYTPIYFKEKGKLKATPLPKKDATRMVMAYKHRTIFREFKFSYCKEEKLGQNNKQY